MKKQKQALNTEKAIIINAENLIVGRLGTFVAKKLLVGQKIIIINSEKAVMSGNEKENLAKLFERRLQFKVKGNPDNAPKHPNLPSAIVKRTIRGMLPWKSSRGLIALRNLRVYNSIPETLKSSKIEKVETAKNNLECNFTEIGKLSKLMGAKW